MASADMIRQSGGGAARHAGVWPRTGTPPETLVPPLRAVNEGDVSCQPSRSFYRQLTGGTTTWQALCEWETGIAPSESRARCRGPAAPLGERNATREGTVEGTAGAGWCGRCQGVPSERNMPAAGRVAEGAGGTAAALVGLMWRCDEGPSPSVLVGRRGRVNDGGSRSVEGRIRSGTPVLQGSAFRTASPRRRGSSS